MAILCVLYTCVCSSAGSVELSKVLLRGWVDVDVPGNVFVPAESDREGRGEVYI